MAKRFRKRGKESLVLLILSDFDPEGEEIAHSFARSMRDDFGVDQIQPVKVALKKSQVIEMILPNDFQAKEKSSRYKRFVARYGTSVHELEAVPPRTLQGLLRDAIDSVLDIEAFNHEID
jgi:protein involved in sex pheromone biosynthesis